MARVFQGRPYWGLLQSRVNLSMGSQFVNEDGEEDEAHGADHNASTLLSAETAAVQDGEAFDINWPKWKRNAHTVQWKEEFPNDLYAEQLADGYQLDAMDDLVKLPIGKYYEKLEKSDEFGHFPRMARSYIGANLSEGFCERMISVANQVMTKGNTLLGDAHLKKLVVLRMNRKFMQYMRAEKQDVSREIAQLKKMSAGGADGRVMVGGESLAGIRVPAKMKQKVVRWRRRRRWSKGWVSV